MDELVTLLNQERHALELLLFRLLGVRGALADEQRRFLAWAANDLEEAASVVEEAGEQRAATVGVSSLRALVETAQEPFATLLDEHRGKLARLATEVETSIRSTRRLAAAGRTETFESFEGLEQAIALTGYDAVLTATAEVRLAGLIDFVG